MLVLLTSEESIQNEDKVLNSLFEFGLERLHIRKPFHANEDYERLIKRLSPDFYPKVFLHEHHHLVDKYHLGGKHYRKKDALTIFNDKYPKSTGVHSIDELLEKEMHYNHLFVSPIFDSISKIGYTAKTNLSITGLPSDVQNKCIALGGINASNIDKAKKMGYNHFAVLGAVWQSSPISSFKTIFQKSRK